MKTFKIIFVVAISCAPFFSLTAQIFGIKAGLNLSKFSVKGQYENIRGVQSYLESVNLGIDVEYPLNDHISLEGGLNFSNKGSRDFLFERLVGVDQFREVDTQFSMSNLDLPIATKVYINKGKARFYINLGPFISFAISGNKKWSIGGRIPEKESIRWNNSNQSDSFARIDYGVLMGVGIEKNRMRIGFTHSRGLHNISAYRDDSSSRIESRALNLFIGYKFRKS